jgi:hypothetical protein
VEIDTGQILQIAFTILGSGLAAYIAVTRKIHGLEVFVRDLRLQQVKECEDHREKLDEKGEKGLKDHEKSYHVGRSGTNPGVANPLDGL